MREPLLDTSHSRSTAGSSSDDDSAIPSFPGIVGCSEEVGGRRGNQRIVRAVDDRSRALQGRMEMPATTSLSIRRAAFKELCEEVSSRHSARFAARERKGARTQVDMALAKGVQPIPNPLGGSRCGRAHRRIINACVGDCGPKRSAVRMQRIVPHARLPRDHHRDIQAQGRGAVQRGACAQRTPFASGRECDGWPRCSHKLRSIYYSPMS